MALINTTTTGILGTTLYGDGAGALTVQQDGVTINKITTTPAFSAYLNADQTITTATFTKVTCQTKEFDLTNAYDNTTNFRFQPNIAGYYYMSANIDVYVTTGSLTQIFPSFYKNGYMARYGNRAIAVSVNEWYAQAGSLIYLNGTTDYVELYAYAVSSSTIKLGQNPTQTVFQGFLVRAV